MNYSVDHDLLQLKELQNLKRGHRTAAWVALSAIRHFTKYTGGMDLYQKQFADDWNFKVSTLQKALELLLKAGLIKIVREYQRKGNIPRKYVTTRLCPQSTKVMSSEHQGYVPRAKVNNSKRIINQNSDDVNTSHSSSISTLKTYKPLSEEEIIKLKEGKK